MDWIEHARAVEGIEIDVGFIISPSFYYGPENGFTHEQWESLRESIYQPQVPLYGQYALSKRVIGLERELITYYGEVLRLCGKHNKPVAQQKSYFWLRPIIYKEGEFSIGFPWYDTYQEAASFFEALSAGGEGEIFWDRDQCWELTAYASGDHIYLREWDPDYGDEHSCISFTRTSVEDQIVGARQRTESIIGKLCEELGTDYWFRR